MSSRTLGVSAAGLAIGLFVYLLLGASWAGLVLLAGAALGWWRAESRRAETATALSAERERASSAREQAWQSALLGQMSEDLRAVESDDELWSRAATTVTYSSTSCRLLLTCRR